MFNNVYKIWILFCYNRNISGCSAVKLQDVCDANLHLLFQVHLEGEVFINQFSDVIVVPVFDHFVKVDILAGIVLHIGIIDEFRIIIKPIKSRP